MNILDKPLSKGNKKYSQARVSQVRELQKRLYDLGYPIGQKLLELYSFRQKKTKKQREIKVVQLLHFICSQSFWVELFGRECGQLEKSGDTQNRYHIFDKNPIEETFISQMSSVHINCCYFTAGIINGAFHAANFNATVKVFLTQDKVYTVYIVDIKTPERQSSATRPINDCK